MTDVRVRMQCSEYGLTDAVIAVGWDTILNYKPDENFANYRFSVKGEMQITCNALPKFTWDVDVEGDPWASFVIMDNGCYIFQVSVDVFCGGIWLQDILVGEFSTTEWRINLEEKYVIVKPKVSELSFADFGIECLKKGWNSITNIYDIPDTIEVRPYVDTYDTFEFQDHYSTPCAGQTPPTGVTEYCFDEVVENGLSPIDYICTFFWHRLTKEGTCDGVDPVPPDLVSDWFYLSGSCPNPLFWKCPLNSHLAAVYSPGRLFRDVMEYLMLQSGCGLTVQSDFFNINPPGLNPSNSAYDKAFLELQELVVFQKSDIKRFDSSNDSDRPSWGMKLKEVFDDLWIMFKVKPSIFEDSILRLEHISFYEALAGNDYTNEYYTRELQRDNSDTPRLTRFYFRDEQCSEYFAGLPIEIYCGEGEAEKRCTQFYTDLIFANDGDNAESVADAGWFLMATEFTGDVRRVIRDNRPLSFTELHENYHVYEMAGAGTINGVEVVPESLTKTRKQPEFKVQKCCDETFDPNNYITTSLGQGKIDNADWNLSLSEILITAKY